MNRKPSHIGTLKLLTVTSEIPATPKTSIYGCQTTRPCQDRLRRLALEHGTSLPETLRTGSICKCLTNESPLNT
jgi:hypothetical protein